MDSRQAHEGGASGPVQGGAARNPADNLTQKDRIRGGRRSAESQVRDSTGRFAGSINRQKQDQQQSGPDQPSQASGRSEPTQ